MEASNNSIDRQEATFKLMTMAGNVDVGDEVNDIISTNQPFCIVKPKSKKSSAKSDIFVLPKVLNMIDDKRRSMLKSLANLS